eukprot:1678009-Rhodomonas_salina.2
MEIEFKVVSCMLCSTPSSALYQHGLRQYRTSHSKAYVAATYVSTGHRMAKHRSLRHMSVPDMA